MRLELSTLLCVALVIVLLGAAWALQSCDPPVADLNARYGPAAKLVRDTVRNSANIAE